MTIYYQPDRQGMTVLPDAIDEATGERIEGSSQVVDTRMTNWHGQSDDTYEDIEVEDEALSPEDVEPSIEIRLSDTEEDIRTGEYTVSDEFANEVASADIGSSPADLTVKYLATKCFQGQMTPEEAFGTAIESGINPDDLMQSYWNLKHYFEPQ